MLSVATEHLVFDLHQIASIEERVLEEQFVAHIFRSRVQCPLLLQCRKLGIFFVGHGWEKPAVRLSIHLCADPERCQVHRALRICGLIALSANNQRASAG